MSLCYVWIALKESIPDITRKLPQETTNLKLYTLIYVDLLKLHVLMEKNILSPLFDDFSHCGYVDLLIEKSQAIDAFEMYINEVEIQLEKKVKVVRSDKGSEFYEKHDEIGQSLKPFEKCLERHNIHTHHAKMV